MDENVNATQGDPAGGEVRHGLIGMVRADEANLRQSASWITTARGGAELHQSASVAVVSGGDTSMKMAAAVMVPTLGDARLEKSGAQWVIAAGDINIEKGGCAAAVAPTVKVDHGAVGVALGWHVDVGEGGRVMFGPLAGAAVGIAFGIGAGLVMAVSAGYAAKKALKRVPQLPWRS